MTTTVLITGASGLLGRQITQEFKKHTSWNAVGLAFSRAKGDLHKVDLTNPEALRAAFEKFLVKFLLKQEFLVLAIFRPLFCVIQHSRTGNSHLPFEFAL